MKNEKKKLRFFTNGVTDPIERETSGRFSWYLYRSDEKRPPAGVFFTIYRVAVIRPCCGRGTLDDDERRTTPRAAAFLLHDIKKHNLSASSLSNSNNMSRESNTDTVYPLFDVPGTGFRDKKDSAMFNQYNRTGWQATWSADGEDPSELQLRCVPALIPSIVSFVCVPTAPLRSDGAHHRYGGREPRNYQLSACSSILICKTSLLKKNN